MDGLDVLLVDGKLTPATGGGTFETVDPATEEVLAVAADGSPADLDAAVAAARRAFDETTWFEEYLELEAVAEAV
jgi:aldehyde dehydrogenase (NAD+)